MTASHHSQQRLPSPSPLPSEPSLAGGHSPPPASRSDSGFSRPAGAACAPSAVCGGRFADALPVSAAKAVGLDRADLSSQAGDRRASGAHPLSGNLETPILLVQRGILLDGDAKGRAVPAACSRRAAGDGQGPAALHPQAPVLPHLPPGFPQAPVSVQFRFVSRPGSLSFQSFSVGFPASGFLLGPLRQRFRFRSEDCPPAVALSDRSASASASAFAEGVPGRLFGFLPSVSSGPRPGSQVCSGIGRL